MTPDANQQPDERRVVVVTQDGMGVANAADREHDSDRDSDDRDREGDSDARRARGRREQTNPADLVEEPAKVMRIGSMIKQLLEEVRNAPLDEAGRRRLADIHHRSIEELKDGLAPELVHELDRIALPFSDASPSDAEPCPMGPVAQRNTGSRMVHTVLMSCDRDVRHSSQGARPFAKTGGDSTTEVARGPWNSISSKPRAATERPKWRRL